MAISERSLGPKFWSEVRSVQVYVQEFCGWCFAKWELYRVYVDPLRIWMGNSRIRSFLRRTLVMGSWDRCVTLWPRDLTAHILNPNQEMRTTLTEVTKRWRLVSYVIVKVPSDSPVPVTVTQHSQMVVVMNTYGELVSVTGNEDCWYRVKRNSARSVVVHHG